MSKEVGITVSKSENFSEWYTQVVIKTELVDYAPVSFSFLSSDSLIDSQME